LLNTTAALATAYALNARVLCLAGQIPLAAIGREGGVLHEIPDQLGIMRSLTKWAARVTTVEEAPALVAQAFESLRSGRPRPAALEVPMDVLAAQGDVDDACTPTLVLPQPLDGELIDAAAQARRPLIWVGGGAHGASAAIRALSEHLQAPVASYRTGRGIADSRHSLTIVQPQAHALWAETDVVLAVGTNMRVPLQTWGTDDALRVVHVDVDPASHDRVHAAVAVTARAEDALPRLLARVAALSAPRPSREAEMSALGARWLDQRSFLQPQIAYLDVIRAALGEHGIFVDELTQVGFSARVVLPVYHPRTFISTGYQGTLGYGFPTALGVKVARPDVPVISVSGDGGFLFGVQELATAVQHRIDVIAIVFNNNRYGNVQHMQRALYGGRVIASDLRNPDFARLADAFGAAGYRAETPAALAEALRCAVSANRPAVIEVPCGDMPDVDRFRKLPRVRGARS
jgi:acetolactate synthase I/II/III large subunit